jgi:phosphoenolpyruvate synthase/pyruvate phosphate dikinase
VTAHVLPLDDCAGVPRASVGGKAAGLGSIAGCGLPIPPGFAVTTGAYREAAGEEALAAIDRVLAAATSLAERVAAAAKLVEQLWPSTPTEDAIREAYAALCERCGTENIAVAIRSSAASEDTEGASFAGEYDSYLWIRGADDVLAAVVRCWSSLFTERALSYREQGRVDTQPAMAVVVQQMVDARAAGVLFSLNPENGDRSKVAIESCWGLGEALVGGEITPDNFLLDKITGEILRRRLATKATEVVFDRAAGRGVVTQPVEPERQELPSLTDEELETLRGHARTAERELGFPVDMEWAVGAGGIAVLQVRPETVWSRRPRETQALTGSAIDSIVSSLVHETN